MTIRSDTSGDKDDDEVKCIKEDNLNFHSIVMIKNHLIGEYTLHNCVTHCLQLWPDHAYVLISYADDFFTPDDFKCMCAHKDGFQDNVRLPEFKCNNMCPESQDKYR